MLRNCVFLTFSDDICEYFGVKIAMYFAWLGMYTKWLIAPAVLGIITFILSNRGEVTRDWCILFFNIFNIVWATLFLEAWKRKSAELAYKWGTMDMPSDALKEPRPLFRVWFFVACHIDLFLLDIMKTPESQHRSYFQSKLLHSRVKRPAKNLSPGWWGCRGSHSFKGERRGISRR